jgi:endo-1,4-beta-xylanase
MLALVTALTLAQQTTALPAFISKQGKPLWDIGSTSILKFRQSGEIATDVQSGTSRTITVIKPGNNKWDTELKTPMFSGRIKKGDTLFFSYVAKSNAAESEANYGLHFQRVLPTYSYSQGWEHRATDQFRRFNFSMVASEDYESGTTEVTLHLASKSQSVTISEFVGYNFGPGFDVEKFPVNSIVYKGQSPSASWRKKADSMIDKNRKSNLSVKVMDRKGKPIEGASVQIKMLAHSYPFGSFTDYAPGNPGPDQEKSRQVMKEMFNRVTVPIYWADWGWDDPKVRANYDSILNWAKDSKMRMRAHCLLYPGYQFFPSRIKAMENDPRAFSKAVIDGTKDRIDILKQYDFESLDVVNELVTCTDVERVCGTEMTKTMFEMARQGWPKTKLTYNDYDIFEGSNFGSPNSKKREEVYKRLITDKVGVQHWGWQGHFGESLTPPDEVWTALDYFVKNYGGKYEITEFDIKTRDEQAQADYTRDLLTAWFAHPATEGFTLWGFWEGSIWVPSGAMFRKDWSPKPNALAWKDLIYKKWWTNASLTTDKKGSNGLRGFKGEYEVTIKKGKLTKVIKMSLDTDSTLSVTL